MSDLGHFLLYGAYPILLLFGGFAVGRLRGRIAALEQQRRDETAQS
jgi:hypothetical protein